MNKITIDRNTIIKLARKAGMNLAPAQFSGVLEDEIDEFQLLRFAALVAAAEREACAQIAEMEPCMTHTPHRIAAAIRARSST